MSTAVTEGIEVTVRSTFRPERSEPGRFLFSYTVRIANQGEVPAQLVSRRWIILDANGEREEVVGDGVVGQQPHLEPGEHFEYTSFCVLKTPHGSMRGTYRMVRDGGQAFDATIAPFPLVVPGTLN
ncbi:ApaG domain protein [Anaeromyxobacter sp. K]|uniref:Protein ApaG n=1 Tax=Anaeromyxobacter sp. (strain K) TaxID=447217 RepID=APAG_ANASK|nr:Co2+/Mg2+ efflux protein ApaG [Anaeromyxobacter sp. K]B4UHA8.1 RecName: Full=Protein ApaG [Anaeromyxobacter sp. K]ACG75350.1 ApaG domain protein [Anaeromyxobacter sp. K]